MPYKHPDGYTIYAGFSINGIKYPPNWLQLTSEEEKAAIGITWEDDPIPEPTPPAPPEVPSVVSMRQARLALLQQNLLATVDAAVAAGGEADKITWEYATEVNRDDALVANLAAGLGLSSTDLDNLFTLAASL